MRAYLYSINFLILVLCTGIAYASDIPHTIAHQGILTSNDGTPVEDGMYSFTVSIYDSESSSDALWTETQTVGVINGIYNLLLGVVEPLDLPFDTHYWIGVSVNGGDELDPRIPLSSVPYAFHAQSVPDGSITSAKLAVESVTQEKIHPDVSLPVGGNAGGDLTGTYPNPAIADGAISNSKIADGAVTSVKLSNNAVTAEKIADESVTSSKLASNIEIITTGTIEADLFIGDGSQLTNLPTNGFALPFSGQTSSSETAFHIRNTGSGTAIRGEADGTTGTTAGVFGRALSNNGTGIWGLAVPSSGTTYGVRGISNSTSGRGVFGQAGAVSGTTYGVYGESSSPTGRGVYGEATSSSGASNGVMGIAASPNGRGVYGVAQAMSGINFGVLGQTNSPEGYGGYFLGRVHVGGNLTKAGGSFEIDHPLDPENMLLRHSFVESPDMMNIYNGVTTLDAGGESWIELPPWFEALNMEFRYQLTSIGQPGPYLYIAEEISNNRFKIAGGEIGMRVSWQVTGVRKDAWAENNRIVVEEYKTPETRGYYLHPHVYHQPETRSIEWGRDPEGMRQLEESIRNLESENNE